MPSPHIICTHDDRVVTIELLSRREKKNAITVDMYRGMSDALDDARADSGIGAVFLRGQADLFTSGNDVADFLEPRAPSERAGHRFLHTIAGFPKPIVAAVGGPAVGIGCTMLLHCDIVVASEGARFQLPFVNLGLCPEAGSSMLVPQMAGQRLAAELTLFGDFFDALTALRAGIVNQVVPTAELLAHGAALARRLAVQPQDAIITTKALLKRPQGRTVQEVIDEEYPHFERLLESDAARKIFRSFLDRR